MAEIDRPCRNVPRLAGRVGIHSTPEESAVRFWLASFPRSGNSFLRIVLRNRYGLPSPDPEDPTDAVLALQYSTIIHPNDREAASAGALGVKTHRLPGSDTDPAVYIVRDGRDAIVSYAHFAPTYTYNVPPAEITTPQVRQMIGTLMREERSPYGTWAENVAAWFARPNTQMIKFEELVAKPEEVADRVVAGLGLGLSPTVGGGVPTFDELNAVNPRFFRKGARGGWREVFTPELTELFWRYNRAAMELAGYGDGGASRAA